MANKLTPEEGIEAIKKGLRKCYESALVLRLDREDKGYAYPQIPGYYLQIENDRKRILEKIKTMINDLNINLNILAGTDLTPVFGDTLGASRDLEQYTDDAIGTLGYRVYVYKKSNTVGDPAEADKFSATIMPLLQRIKEEIKILQAICKQLAK